jgi:hypothetical protein
MTTKSISKILNLFNESDGAVPSFLISTSPSNVQHFSLERPLEILKEAGIFGKKLEDAFFSADYDSSQDALKKLHSFLATKPLFLKRKFIWWPIKDDFNFSIQNKLLKTIEDAGESFGFIFCKYSAKPLLPTIESRLITIRLRSLSSDSSQEPSAVQSLFATSATTFQEFQKQWEEGQWTEKYVLGRLADKLMEAKYSNFLILEKFGQLLDWFNKSSQWNNPLVERRYMLFQYVRLLS